MIFFKLQINVADNALKHLYFVLRGHIIDFILVLEIKKILIYIFMLILLIVAIIDFFTEVASEGLPSPLNLNSNSGLNNYIFHY